MFVYMQKDSPRNLIFLPPCEELLSPLSDRETSSPQGRKSVQEILRRGRTSWNIQGQAEGHRTDWNEVDSCCLWPWWYACPLVTRLNLVTWPISKRSWRKIQGRWSSSRSGHTSRQRDVPVDQIICVSTNGCTAGFFASQVSTEVSLVVHPN